MSIDDGIKTTRKKEFIYPAIILAIVTIAVFGRAYSLPVMKSWDDDWLIHRQIDNLGLSWKNIAHWLSDPGVDYYVPLTMFSYMLDYCIGGVDGTIYHIQNIFWHIVAVLGVFACSAHFLKNRWIAFCVALMFAVHPQRTEAVAWVAARRETLSAAFYFWSIFAFLKCRRDKGICYAAVILFACSLLSKPMAVSLPFVLLFYEFHRKKSFNPWGYIRTLWPYFLMAALYSTLTLYLKYKPHLQKSLDWKLYLVFHNITWYVVHTFFPCELSPIYPKLIFSLKALGKSLVVYIVFILYFFAACKKNSRNFIFNVLPLTACYIVSVIPVAGFFQIGTDYFDYADRYSYVPSTFLLLGAGCFVESLMANPWSFTGEPLFGRIKWQKIFAGAFILYILFLGGVSFFYLKTWQSYRSLMSMAALYDPPSAQAVAMLGVMAINEGDYRRTNDFAEKILLLSKERVSPGEKVRRKIMGHFLKGSALWLKKDKRKALLEFEIAEPLTEKMEEPIEKSYSRMFSMMSDCYRSSGNPGKAEKCYEKIFGGMLAEGKGDSSDYWFFKGNEFYISGKYDSAVNAFKKALKRDSGNKMILFNLRQSEQKMAESKLSAKPQ